MFQFFIQNITFHIYLYGMIVDMSIFYVIFLIAFADHELLLITEDSIKKYDTATSKITMPIDDQYTSFSHLNDVDFDSELQLMFYLIDMKIIYSYNLLTNEKKVFIASNFCKNYS